MDQIRSGVQRRAGKVSYAAAATLVACAALPAGAIAEGSGGAAPVVPGTGTPAPAPAKKPPRPLLTDIRCSSNGNTACIETHRVENGGSIILRGTNLSATSAVVFYGERGRKDDVTAATSGTDATYAKVVVPPNARSGPIGALTTGGPRSARWSGLVIEAPGGNLHPYKQSGVSAPVEATVSQPRRISVGGLHKSVFSYELSGQQALDVQINLTNQATGAVMRSWSQPGVAPDTLQRIVWDGTGADGKTALPDGRYLFQVVAPGGGAVALPASASKKSGKAAAAPDSVALVNFAFPLTGKYTFGTSINRFGAGRTGHTHAGHDIMANCGVPIVAARGGKVTYSGYQGAAGNYVAIDGADTNYDFAYMHLREHAMVETGDRVYTGQPLGYVGDTGDATACHLHFELWQGGWYDGGHAIDPLPMLKRWARK